MVFMGACPWFKSFAVHLNDGDVIAGISARCLTNRNSGSNGCQREGLNWAWGQRTTL